MNSLKKNTFFNFLLTISNLLFPLITMPYISRILNISDIGIVNKGTALYTLFINLSSFGLINYAAREIARCRDDEMKMNEVFFSVLFSHCVTTLFFLIVFVIYIFSIDNESTKKVLIFNAILLAISPLTIEWFYTGKEEFKYISIRSISVKLITFISVFIFVRNENDFIKYAFLTVIAQGANTFFNIIHVRKYVRFHKFKFPLKNIFINSRFFYLQTLVAICYQNLNQIFLGSSDTTELALYVRAATFSTLTSSFISPIGNAVKPRIESMVNKNEADYKKYIDMAFDCSFSLLCPIVFGMGILSDNIMIIFGGEQFRSGAIVLVIVLFSAFFAQLSTFINSIIAIPTGNEKNTFIANSVVAVLSIILNLLLINQFGAIGAAFAVMFSEMSGTIIQTILVKKEKLYFGWFNWRCLKYLITSIIMAFVIFVIKKMIINIYIETVVCVIIGIIIYTFVTLMICLVTKDRIPYLLQTGINILKTRFLKVK